MARIVWPPESVEGETPTQKMVSKGRPVQFTIGARTFQLYGYAVHVADARGATDGSLIYVPGVPPEEL